MHGISSDLTFLQSKQAISQANSPAYLFCLPFPAANQPQYPSVVLRLLQTDTHSSLLSPFFAALVCIREEAPRGETRYCSYLLVIILYASNKDGPARRREKTGVLLEQSKRLPSEHRLGLLVFAPSNRHLLLRFFSPGYKPKGDLPTLRACPCPRGLAKAIFLASRGPGPFLSQFLYYSNGRLFRDLIMLGSLSRLS